MEPFSLPVLLAGLAVIFTITYLILNKGHRGKNLPPGPRGLERLRGIYYILTTGRMPEMAAQWAERYGDVVRIDGFLLLRGSAVVFLNDASIVREFYTGKSTRGIANSRYVDRVVARMAPSITFRSPENSNWAKERKLFHQALQFYGEGYQSMERTVQEELDNVVTILNSRDGEDVEVRPLFFNSILNLIHILLTGEQLPADSSIRQDMTAYIGSFVSLLSDKFRLKVQYFPFLLYLPGSVKTAMDGFNRNVKRMMDHFYYNVKATHTAGHIRGIVDAWLEKMEEEDNAWITETRLHGMISDVFTGGTLTTSESLTSMFLFLLSHGDVVRKIQAEVDRVVGPGGRPSLEDRERCPYTQAVLLETHRVLSLLPMSVGHKVIQDTEIRGYFIPKGTLVLANQWRFHRSDALWSDALEFQPERFLDEQGQLLPATHPLRQQLLPFGIGMRSCPGESFARARMFLYVTTILQHFDPLPPQKGELPPVTPELDSWKMSAFMIAQGYSCRFAKRRK